MAAGLAERKFVNKRLDKTPEGSAIVITGCSSGFGFQLATRAANNGTFVFAGVRKEEDFEKLEKGTMHPENIHPLILDVTNEEQVSTAAELVDKILLEKGLTFLALVNNAGYGAYAPIEAMANNTLRNMMEVNVFGVISMVQAFVPVMRKYKASKSSLASRIIMVSSGAGRVSLPTTGQYCASKYALEALSDALRMEMKPWNIQVSLVEPGRFSTEFQNKAYTELQCESLGKLEEDVKSHYIALQKEHVEKSNKRNRPASIHAVEVMEDALLDTKPLARYLAGSDVQTGVPIINAMNSNETFTDLILAGPWKTLRK